MTPSSPTCAIAIPAPMTSTITVARMRILLIAVSFLVLLVGVMTPWTGYPQPP